MAIALSCAAFCRARLVPPSKGVQVTPTAAVAFELSRKWLFWKYEYAPIAATCGNTSARATFACACIARASALSATSSLRVRNAVSVSVAILASGSPNSTSASLTGASSGRHNKRLYAASARDKALATLSSNCCASERATWAASLTFFVSIPTLYIRSASFKCSCAATTASCATRCN